MLPVLLVIVAHFAFLATAQDANANYCRPSGFTAVPDASLAAPKSACPSSSKLFARASYDCSFVTTYCTGGNSLWYYDTCIRSYLRSQSYDPSTIAFTNRDKCLAECKTGNCAAAVAKTYVTWAKIVDTQALYCTDLGFSSPAALVAVEELTAKTANYVPDSKCPANTVERQAQCLELIKTCDNSTSPVQIFEQCARLTDTGKFTCVVSSSETLSAYNATDEEKAQEFFWIHWLGIIFGVLSVVICIVVMWLRARYLRAKEQKFLEAKTNAFYVGSHEQIAAQNWDYGTPEPFPSTVKSLAIDLTPEPETFEQPAPPPPRKSTPSQSQAQRDERGERGERKPRSPKRPSERPSSSGNPGKRKEGIAQSNNMAAKRYYEREGFSDASQRV